MSIVINTNISSLTAQRDLSKSTNKLGDTFGRLSSGLRINSAKDDSAGIAISTRMTAQIRGLNQSLRNVNDAISLVQTAEGAMDSMINAAQRIRELAVQGANETYTTQDRETIVSEMLWASDVMLDTLPGLVTFNGKNLVGGNDSGATEEGAAEFTFHIGANSSESFVIEVADADWIQDEDYGGGGKAFDQLIAEKSTANFEALIAAIDVAMFSRPSTLTDTTQTGLVGIRSYLGSVQNRLESIAANITTEMLNTTQARSRIMDADIAQETAKLTQSNIMQQASTAILAQANQQPSIVMQLLR